MAALKQYAAAIEDMEHDLGRLRDDNQRQAAVLDAAADLRPPAAAPPDAPTPTAPTPTSKPRPRPRPTSETPKKPPGERIKICNSDDPLAEDC
jgi:hypothetical protein